MTGYADWSRIQVREQTFDLDLLLAHFGTVQSGGAEVGDYNNDSYVADGDLGMLLTALALNQPA